MSPDERLPFFESRTFKGMVALVGLAAAVWGLTGAPKPWQVASDLAATEKPLSNTAIVVDASAAMGEKFGPNGRSKLDAAVDAVREYVVPFDNEGIALRRAGGTCEDRGQVLVDFGAHHTDDVSEAVAELKPAGRSNLGYAVMAAIDEFNASGRFTGPPSSKRVVVFTGGADQCLEEDAAEQIERELERTGIDAVFTLVALRVSDHEKKRLKAFSKALGKRADVDFVDTPDELDESMERAQERAVTETESAAASSTGEFQEPSTDDEESSADESTAEDEERLDPGQGDNEGETEAPPDESGVEPSEGAESPGPEPEPEPEPEPPPAEDGGEVGATPPEAATGVAPVPAPP
ncbi:MAG TPA: vWA domain-containing protein [Solirubrobacterales bacterium]